MRKIKKYAKRFIIRWSKLLLKGAGYALAIWIALSIINVILNDPLSPSIWEWNFFKVMVSLSPYAQ